MKHSFAAVGDEREERDGNQRDEQVRAVEVVRVEDCDDEDCDEVIDHRQGQQEDAHRRGEEGTNGGEYGHGEGDVGGGGDCPTVQRGGATEVDGRVDDGGGDDAAEGRRDGYNRGGGRLEVANHELLLELQAGEEEEDHEQTVCGPCAHAHLQVFEPGDVGAEHGVTHSEVEGGCGGVG